jgi:hypothetical protein
VSNRRLLTLVNKLCLFTRVNKRSLLTLPFQGEGDFCETENFIKNEVFNLEKPDTFGVLEIERII